MVKLNLGCGRNPEPGFVNIDIRAATGVDVVRDLDPEGCLHDVPTASVEHVRAFGLLEHLWHWENVVHEVARVLMRHGAFEIRVPYRTDYVAYHVRHFGKDTFNPYRSDWRRRNDFFLPEVPRFGSLEFQEPYFTLKERWTEHHIPLSWHIERYTGINVARLPLGPRLNLRFVLERNETPWRGTA